MLVCILSAVLMALTQSPQFKLQDTSKLYSLALNEHLSRIERGIKGGTERRKFISGPIYIACDDSSAIFNFSGKYKVIYWDDSLKGALPKNELQHLVKIESKSIRGKFIIVPVMDYIFENKGGQLDFTYGGGRLYFYTIKQPEGKITLEKSEVVSY
ncbi:hypothetical protein AAHN97_21700 [Chitinophaga niabensis]|uniref:hypothetical protein n=1 Tax=Chitinophaga niabensis TaxID=536979 RepID=UPI0031BAC603